MADINPDSAEERGYGHSLAVAERARITEMEQIVAECQTYHEPRIRELEKLLDRAQREWQDIATIGGDIGQCRYTEGDSITILCDNPEADSAETQAVVEACGGYTGYQPHRYYGRTWEEAVHKAANAARAHYSVEEEAT